MKLRTLPLSIVAMTLAMVPATIFAHAAQTGAWLGDLKWPEAEARMRTAPGSTPTRTLMSINPL